MLGCLHALLAASCSTRWAKLGRSGVAPFHVLSSVLLLCVDAKEWSRPSAHWDTKFVATQRHSFTMGAANAKRDMERYRAGYPGQRDDPRMTDNIRFYRNKLSSSPNGDYIDRIHKNWFGSYAKLEAHHGYIQWLFPIREHGMNGAAQPLQVHEARSIVGDPECMERVFKSYELMLDFYGFRLANRESGELVRSDNCHDRFDNLNYHGHNYLRITRILKFLGEVELEHLKFPFLATMVHEVYEEKALRNCARSLEQYWSETLKDREQRRQLHDLIRIHNPDHSGCVEEDGDGARTSPPGTPPR